MRESSESVTGGGVREAMEAAGEDIGDDADDPGAEGRVVSKRTSDRVARMVR
jgi:hypothetical protein